MTRRHGAGRDFLKREVQETCYHRIVNRLSVRRLTSRHSVEIDFRIINRFFMYIAVIENDVSAFRFH